MIINFKVDNQKLTLKNHVFLADKSQNLIQCQFIIKGDDWIDKQIFALLKDNECNTYQLHIPANNIISIPTDIVQQEKFSISLYGEDTEDTRITTNQISFRLANSGYTTDLKDLEDIDENIWVQIFDGIDSKSSLDHKHNLDDITDLTLSNVAITGSYDDLEDKPLFSNVALTGEYTDLLNIPTLPVKTSDLLNDGDGVNPFLTQHQNINGKVDKIPGKGLSTEDFTTSEKNKLKTVATGANRYEHPLTHPVSMITGLGSVAVSNSYDDLDDRPSIPVNVSDLVNDTGFITMDEIIGKQDKSNLVTNLNVTSNSTYPSSKCVKNYVDELIGNISDYVNR